MAKKQALRELQTRLAERLQAARDQAPSANWLAVESGGLGFLFPLAEAGEIVTGASGLMPVPHTSRWFMGVANLRGHLHGVVDFAVFLGLRRAGANLEAPGRDQTCLIAFNSNLEINCALLVDRLSGLRSREQLSVDEEAAAAPRPAFLNGIWRDAQGKRWHEVGLAALSGHESFLRIFE